MRHIKALRRESRREPYGSSRRLTVLLAATCLAGAAPSAALAQACAGTTQTFTQASAAGTRTGALETFTVPTGVTSITIDAAGAAGGTGELTGGLGARVVSTFSVTSADTLCVLVGVAGEDGVGGGGGGGGSFVFSTSDGSCDFNEATAISLLIAAGGGGGGTFASSGAPGLPGLGTGLGAGAAGALNGGASTNGAAGGTGGNGGANAFAGGGGGLLTDGGSGLCRGGGALAAGATGGNGCNMVVWGDGAFGGGGSTGGGGGYNGGGAINAGSDRNGGGGSFSAVAPTTAQDGVQAGNGSVTLCYVVAAPAPVPTLSEWAMILFGTILAGGAALCIQRRRFIV